MPVRSYFTSGKGWLGNKFQHDRTSHFVMTRSAEWIELIETDTDCFGMTSALGLKSIFVVPVRNAFGTFVE